MIINRTGDSLVYETITYTIGEKIYADIGSDLRGLFGTIMEIRTGEDKNTENEVPDIYCSFEPPILPEDVRKLEELFSELYGEPKKLADIALDEVIMAPGMINKLTPWEQMTTEEVYLPVFPEQDKQMSEKPELFTGMSDVGRRISEYTAQNGTGEMEVDIKHCSLVTDQTFQRKMYKIYRRKCIVEDMAGLMEQNPDFADLPEEIVQKIFDEPHLADRFDDILGKSNVYWGIYWDCVDSLVRELVGKFSPEREGDAV
ncbi:MAG: hypothetical protein IJ733_13400 [Lachnospiraceae bacterium]|nr:hypothetical protein [Lachnospiraceae bacterium]